MPDLTITLPEDQMNFVTKCVSRQPWEDVNPIMVAMINQQRAQQQMAATRSALPPIVPTAAPAEE